MRGGGYLSSSSLCQRKSNRIFVHWAKILYFVILLFQCWQRKYYHRLMTIIKSLWHASTIFALKAILHVTYRNHTTSNASFPKLNHKLYHFWSPNIHLKHRKNPFIFPSKCYLALVRSFKRVREESVSVYSIYFHILNAHNWFSQTTTAVSAQHQQQSFRFLSNQRLVSNKSFPLFFSMGMMHRPSTPHNIITLHKNFIFFEK